MKKFSVVLLVAVLAVSSVFAALTGFVQAKYTINFDAGTFAYSDPTSVDDLTAKLSFDTVGAAKKGNGKAYVDAAASFAFTAEGISDGGRYGLSRLGYFQLAVDKLTIVGEDWTWNLLEAEEVGGYADSSLDFHKWYRNDHMKGNVEDKKAVKRTYTDLAKTTKSNYSTTVKDDYADYAKKVAYGAAFDFVGDSDVFGTTFKKGGYTVALAANGHVGEYTTKSSQIFYFGVESKEFELGDATVQAAFGTSYRDDAENDAEDLWTLGASFKAAYATDDVSVSVATDQMINTNGHETAKKGPVTPVYNGDVLVKATVGPVSADVFFAKNAVSKKGDDKGFKWEYGVEDLAPTSTTDYSKDYADKYFKNSSNKRYFSDQGLYKQNIVKNLFSFQVKADLNEFDIPATVTFQALNMINDAKIFNVLADAKLGDLSLSVYAKDLLASYDKIYVEQKAGYKKADYDGTYYYWKENGSSQKLGIDAAYVVDEALSVKAGFFAQLGQRKIGANVGATYVADLFTADASLAAEFFCASKDEVAKIKTDDPNLAADEWNKMQLIVGAKSDKLVDGAVLSIEYKSGNLIDNLKGEYDFQNGQQAGKLTTKCKVTF